MSDREEICDNCKFFHKRFSTSGGEGDCRRNAPERHGGSGLHSDMSSWPKVYANSMFCGEFKDKDSKGGT